MPSGKRSTRATLIMTEPRQALCGLADAAPEPAHVCAIVPRACWATSAWLRERRGVAGDQAPGPPLQLAHHPFVDAATERDSGGSGLGQGGEGF